MNIHGAVGGNAAVLQRLVDADIVVVQFHIFAHKTDFDRLYRVAQCVQHFLPVGKIRCTGAVNAQLADHHIVHVLLVEHDGHGIENVTVVIFNDALRIHIAEQGDLVLDLIRQRVLRAANDNIRIDADGKHFLYTVLGGLAFQLIGGCQVGHQGHMDKQAVLSPGLHGKLANGLQKRLALNIAYGAADFYQAYIGAGVRVAGDGTLDLIGHMGNDLNGLAAIYALALVGDHFPVHASGGQVGVLAQGLVNKALIVPQIQVRFRAVVGNEYLAVLYRVHGARVHIQVRVQLLRGDL